MIDVALLDSIKSKTSQGLSKALSTTEAVLKKAELNRQMQAKRDAMEELFTEFGRRCFSIGAFDEAAFVTMQSTAKDIESQIHALDDEMRALDSKSGKSDDTPSQSAGKVCASCGAEVAPDQKFCGSCGATL